MYIRKGVMLLIFAGALSLSTGTAVMANHNSAKSSEDSAMKVGGTMDGKTLYLVESEAQLRSIGTGKYGLDQAYMLSQNIELTKEWKPIGTKKSPFTGTFWGNGCEIKNLKITDPNATVIGLFGYAENASIYNVTFTNMDIDLAGKNVKNKFVNAACAVPNHCTIYDIFIK